MASPATLAAQRRTIQPMRAGYDDPPKYIIPEDDKTSG
jgi:hypothetical protein